MRLMEIIVRRPKHDETQIVSRIWETVFGATDTELFFNHYYDPEFCAVAIYDNMPVAAGHLIPVGDFVFGDFSAPCAMIYAVATLPQMRGCGYGSAVVRELISLAYSADEMVAALCPSDDELFGYYASHTAMCDFFYANEKCYENARLTRGSAELAMISPAEYGRLRETFLLGVPHIIMDFRALSYQNSLCALFGGGLIRVETPDGICCAVVERQSRETMWVKEMLIPQAFAGLKAEEFTQQVLSEIGAAFAAERYIVRTPAARSETGFPGRRFGMLAAQLRLTESFSESLFKPWIGLAFD